MKQTPKLSDEQRRIKAQQAAYSTSTKAIEQAAAKLFTFDNAYPERDYLIRIDCPEFTAVCPMTGQPDFGSVIVEYTPEHHCLELKAYKLYIQAYRDVGIFHEAATNRILDDLVKAVQPRTMKIIGQYRPRGGIQTTVTADYKKPQES